MARAGIVLFLAIVGVVPLSAQAGAGPKHPHQSKYSWPKFAAGFAASLLAHELAHVGAAFAVGGDPSVVLDSGRPVIRSGIDPNADPAGPFAFSAAGMGTQLPINEVVFLLPHRAPRASAFEYGLMAGGIGTVAFYLSVGRSSEVGDVQQMVQHSGLSTWGVTAIFGGVALAEIVRLALSKRYLNFFATPTPQNELAFGVSSDF